MDQSSEQAPARMPAAPEPIRRQLAAALQRYYEQNPPQHSPQLSDEDLILFATGHGEMLSEPKRRAAVQQVAADEQTAELVAELAHLAQSGQMTPLQSSFPTDSPRDPGSTSQAERRELDVARRLPFPLMAGLTTVWAAAACLTFAGLIWRIAASPAEPAHNPQPVAVADPTEEPDRGSSTVADAGSDVAPQQADPAQLDDTPRFERLGADGPDVDLSPQPGQEAPSDKTPTDNAAPAESAQAPADATRSAQADATQPAEAPAPDKLTWLDVVMLASSVACLALAVPVALWLMALRQRSTPA